jgi:hypothetical protein
MKGPGTGDVDTPGRLFHSITFRNVDYCVCSLIHSIFLPASRECFPWSEAILGVQRGAETSVRVDRQLACLTGQPVYLKDPKSNAGTRTLPLAPQVAEALADHVRNHPPLTIELPWGKPTGVLVTVALLFHRDGKPINRTLWSLTWRQVQRDAGVADVDFHSLRHYAVSYMIRYGATPRRSSTSPGTRRARPPSTSTASSGKTARTGSGEPSRWR